mgnify:CR=1 FL=1
MIKTIRGFMKRLNEDHVGAYAAQSAYFILLSFIPFVLLVVTLVKYTPLTRDDVYSVLINMLPTEFQSYVGGIVNEIFYQSVAYMPITIITTLWSAGKGIAALTNGLNSIYHVTETRNYIINRLRGMAYTLIFVAAFLTSLVLLVFGTRIQNKLTEHLPMVARVTSSIMGMRTLITTGVLALLFLVLYKCIPNRKASFKSQCPGALISSLAWSIFSLAFSMYLDIALAASNMYGSLTMIVFIMIWMYFCMWILLIGAEINAYFEDKLRKLQNAAIEHFMENKAARDACSPFPPSLAHHLSTAFPAARGRACRSPRERMTQRTRRFSTSALTMSSAISSVLV